MSGKLRQGSLRVHDAEIYVEEHGAGRPLVLVHGGLESGRTWRALVPQLQTQFRVIVVDVRGHGRSTNPAGRLTYPQIADDIAVVLARLEVRDPLIAGWSDGGQHVLHLGTRYPGLAAGLIAGAADFDCSPSTKGWVREFFGTNAAGHVDPVQVEQSLGGSAAHFRAMHAGGDRQWQRLLQQTACMWLEYEGLPTEDYRRITCPTLILAGDRDADVPVEDTVHLYRALPDGELALCPGGDHYIPWRRPDWFIATLLDFSARRLSE